MCGLFNPIYNRAYLTEKRFQHFGKNGRLFILDSGQLNDHRQFATDNLLLQQRRNTLLGRLNGSQSLLFAIAAHELFVWRHSEIKCGFTVGVAISILSP